MKVLATGSLLALAFLPALACAQLLGDFEVATDKADASTSGDGAVASADSASADGAADKKCVTDNECPPLVTEPPSCATAKCAVVRGVCVYSALDRDKDGQPAANCVAQDGTAIDLGKDCDDSDPTLFAGHPGDCATGPDGGVVVFPGGAPKGQCKAGKRTCVGDKPSACVGVVAPAPEDCTTTTIDEDCDGSPTNGCPCAPLNGVQPCDVHPGLDGKGICKAGSQTCQTGGWSKCTGGTGPAARDCLSSEDNDCSGTPDNTVDPTVCKCQVTGLEVPCNTHPGKDGVGVCKAGSQKCNGTSTSTSYGACTGDVGPSAEDCTVSSGDLDCDGIKGNGAGCTVTVTVFIKPAPYLCGSAASSWPQLYLADALDVAVVPAAYVAMTTFKLFANGGAQKVDLHRCYNATGGYYFIGYGGCSGGTDQRLLGYASAVNGGTGWVELAEFFGTNFSPTGAIRVDDPKCCTGNCSPTGRYTLK